MEKHEAKKAINNPNEPSGTVGANPATIPVIEGFARKVVVINANSMRITIAIINRSNTL